MPAARRDRPPGWPEDGLTLPAPWIVAIVAPVSRPRASVSLLIVTAAVLAACASSPSAPAPSIPIASEFVRFLEAYGGARTFGQPILAREEEAGRIRQVFTNAELVYDPALPESARISLEPLGYSLGLAAPPVPPPAAEADYFESTGHSLDPRLEPGFESAGGASVVGAPIAEAMARGAYLVQYFENLGLRLPLEGSSESFEFLAYGYASRSQLRAPAGTALPPDARARPFALFLDPYGGEAVFGRALSEARAAADGALEQTFTNAVLYAPPDSPGSVRLRPLGSALGPPEPAVTGSGDTVGLYVPASGHYVLWAFAEFYRAHGGEVVLGLPLEEGKTVDGVLQQRFENVVLEYRPELPPHLAVQLAPLGVTYAGMVPQPGETTSSSPPSPRACSGVASVITQPELAIVPAGSLQRIAVQVIRPDGPPWPGITPLIVVHTPAGDLYPPVPATDSEGRTSATLSIDGLRPGEIVNYEVVVAAEECTGYAIGQFAAGL